MSERDTERVEVTTNVPRDAQATWVCRRPARGKWGAAAAGLREAGAALKALPIATIVEAIDRVAARWCDASWPVRVAVRDEVARVTGFSKEAVDRSFDLELRNYRADSLWRTLRRELGDPRVLDAPQPDAELRGATMAVGPELVLTIFTGNVPGLPALSIVRSLIVKAPVVAKVASGEPTFAAAFARSLHEELPALGDAVLVTYWGRDERHVFEELAKEAEVVVAYGGVEACRAVRAALPPATRLVEHGHKLSFGFLSSAYLARTSLGEIGRALAKDTAAFNQHACIAPQAYFVEGSVESARAVMNALGDALAAEARACPLGDLDTLDAARIRLARAQHAWRAATTPSLDVRHDDGLEWSVMLTDRLAAPEGLGHRTIAVVAVASFADLLEQVRPFKEYLQNVGLGCTEDELREKTAALAALGASRICAPGRMPEPSMMWRHDGTPCVAALVRWCDVEMHDQLRGER
jgi:hypothetical protein